MDPVHPSSFNAFLSKNLLPPPPNLPLLPLPSHPAAYASSSYIRTLSHDSYIGNGKLQHERM